MNELTILVIEDDKTIQNFLKISLQTKGYKYILADNGLSGISYFYADNPDLILLDLGPVSYTHLSQLIMIKEYCYFNLHMLYCHQKTMVRSLSARKPPDCYSGGFLFRFGRVAYSLGWLP